jgi:glycosyltransferase involved in cell wall biosynthesis
MAFPPGAVILQVVPALQNGGVERGTVEIVQAIGAFGGTALVASAGGRLVASVTEAGGRHITLKLASKNPVRIWRNAAALASVIRAEQVRVVHARSRAPAWSAWLAARRTGAKFLTTYHAPYDESTPGKRAYNSIMAKGERVIAISHFIAELVRERYAVPSGRIRLIPRGVDPVAFDPDAVDEARVAALRTAWGLPDGHRIVLLPARLSRWKGHGVLIDALRWSRTEGLLAVLAGPLEQRGRYEAELRKRADAQGVGSRVRFVGQCDDMPAALALADVVVNASTVPEGFGRTVIEAQAMRRPVIAADHGGAVETVEHGVSGWRVQPGDPVALAAAIDRVLGLSAGERSAVGIEARRSVLARYTTAAMQKATLAVYSELLG